jgi:hypothetical protein
MISGDDKSQLVAKLQRAAADPRPVKTLLDARARIFAAVALADAQPAAGEKALQTVFDGFWNGFIASLRNAKSAVSNADAYAMLEILHVVRDNLNFDLRETFPEWFRQYPLLHLLAHYPAPWPAAENEFRIPADETIAKTGPDVRKASLSRAAELAMVAYDANAASSQLLQGWVTNDRFLMRGTYGIAYELLWANPYQPGLSYYHVPLALHDEIGGSYSCARRGKTMHHGSVSSAASCSSSRMAAWRRWIRQRHGSRWISKPRSLFSPASRSCGSRFRDRSPTRKSPTRERLPCSLSGSTRGILITSK